MPEKLPKGWVKTTLGEIAEPSRERALPAEFPAMRYVGLEHIEPQTMKLLGHAYAHEVRSSSVRFSKNDVLYAKLRPYLNKVWVAEFNGLCSAEFLVFCNREGLNSQFLAVRLNAEDFVTFSNGQVSGERPRVDFDKLSPFPILLPPTAEQERIVAKLNAALSRVERAESAAHRAQKRLKQYRFGVIDAAVAGKFTHAWRMAHRKKKMNKTETGEALLLRLLAARRARWEDAELRRLRAAGKAPKNDAWKSRYREPIPPSTNDLAESPSGWTWASIDQLSWHSGYGTSVKCTYEGRGPAVLRIPNIRNRTLDFRDLKFAASSRDFANNQFVAPGDLLLIRTNGSKDLIGRAAVVRTEPNKKCGFASYLIRFRLVGKEDFWSWLSLAWDSRFIRAHIEAKAKTTAGQYNVSLSNLSVTAIPLPTPAEQSECVREVERRLSAADRLEATLEQQFVRAHATRQSLLRDAFSGRLVPRNMNDEPASVSLTRIHAAREAETQKPKPKPMPKSKSKSKVPRRALLAAIRAHKKPMTPEQLFRDAGFEASQVDLFYRELTSLRDKLREQRPKGAGAKLWPHRAVVLLQLKRGS